MLRFAARTAALSLWVACATASLATASLATLPLVEVDAADHFELGLAVGRSQRDSLRRFFDNPAGAFRKTLKPFYETSAGREFVGELFRTASNVMPKYVDELRGMAEGSGIHLAYLFIQNCESEIDLLVSSPVARGEHCTDVLSAGENGTGLVAHNEDYSPETIGHVFLLNATIRSSGESFVAFMYPGTLAGWAFGFNQHGLIQTANAVFPKQVQARGAVPVVFSTRLALSARSPSEARSLLASSASVPSSGIGLNLASVSSGEVMSLELASDGSDTMLVAPNSFLVHFNQYIHNPMRAFEIEDASSVARNRTVTGLVRENPELPFSMAGARRILGDTSDPDYPVYRSGNKDDVYTLCTALFDLSKKTLDVLTCRPSLKSCEASYTFEIASPERSAGGTRIVQVA